MSHHVAMAKSAPISILTSTKRDYRSLILRTFEQRKSRNPGYSFRAYARDLNLTPSHLTGVLQGLKGISQVKAQKICNEIKLNPTEEQIFMTSAGALHARSTQTRKSATAAWQQAQQDAEFKSLSLNRFAIVASWYHYAILELWHLKTFQCNPQWIAQTLGISIPEAEMALGRLERAGLLTRGKDGSLTPSSNNNAAGEDIPSQALRQHHKQVIKKAQASIEDQSVDERDLSTMTMAIHSSQLPQAKALIKEFRRKFDRIMAESPEKDRVYCLAIQFFNYTQGNKDL